jgi:hypothetical protein
VNWGRVTPLVGRLAGSPLPIPFADDQLTEHEHGAAEVWRPSFEIEALATVPQIYLCRRTQVVPSLTRSAGGCVAPVFVLD